MTMLVCASCNEMKPKEDYYLRPERRRGADSYCRDCRGKLRSERYNRRKALNLCPKCGKPNPNEARVHCDSCSEYFRDRDRRIYGENGETRQALTRRKLKEEYVSLFGGACTRCGHVSVGNVSLVFHHIKPELKDHSHWQRSDNLKELIDKNLILLLCHNCHDELHYAFRHWWRGVFKR